MRVLERGRRAHERYRGPTERVIYNYLATLGTGGAAADGVEAVGVETATAADGATTTGEAPQYVYRVHGGGAAQWGQSWTPENPFDMADPRAQLGLPKENAGSFVTKAAVQNTEGVKFLRAEPLDGNPGGAPEWRFPYPQIQLSEIWTIPVDPPF